MFATTQCRRSSNIWILMTALMGTGFVTVVDGSANDDTTTGEEAGSRLSLDDQPIGWASILGGTTGGRNGRKITAADAKTLLGAVKGDDPCVVLVSGMIQLDDKVQVGSNKTILGVGAGAGLRGGGLNFKGVHNVIVRNLTIRDTPDDAINIERASHHIWIDHCDLSNCHDGLIDIKAGSDLITVSWNHLHDHGKTCLLGHSDKAAAVATDKGKLRVTYHHNLFDGTQTRHPRVRAAETVQVFNNYFRSNQYGVASTMDAGVLVEGNYFEDVAQPTHTQYGDSPNPGRLVERRNVFVRSGKPSVRGSVREVDASYAYTLDDAAEVPAIVRAGAGAGRDTQRD